MEGIGGNMVFLSDLLYDNSEEVRFPGYEILYWLQLTLT